MVKNQSCPKGAITKSHKDQNRCISTIHNVNLGLTNPPIYQAQLEHPIQNQLKPCKLPLIIFVPCQNTPFNQAQLPQKIDIICFLFIACYFLFG